MHVSVLKKEVLRYFAPKPNENFIDATINGGGHAKIILEKISPNGKLLGIDRDKDVIAKLREESKSMHWEKRLLLERNNFKNLKSIILKHDIKPISGILFDLGFSSWHLETSNRGFSFQCNEPLDMRYNSENDKGLTAAEIVNQWTVSEIAKILKDYGEEDYAFKIAKQIILSRKKQRIITTDQLVEIISKVIPFKRGKIHPATKTFQALRIRVNDELECIKEALPQAKNALALGGRLAIISFHSLEDKIVKDFFKNSDLKILTKKPIRPSLEEIKINSKSRSARLRVGVKV